jgi:hypothetical protein
MRLLGRMKRLATHLGRGVEQVLQNHGPSSSAFAAMAAFE